MLKNISKLFLGLVVCAGSACVTPTHASSASPVIITHVQAAYPQDPKDEMIALYNNSDEPFDISLHCLTNKRQVKIACFTPGENEKRIIPPRSYTVAASQSYVLRHNLSVTDVGAVMATINQSTGDLVNSADTVTFNDPSELPVDSFSWVDPLPQNTVAQRQPSGIEPFRYEAVEPTWRFEPLTEPLENSLISEPLDDEPPQPNDPDNPVIVMPPNHPRLTELFPNPTGSDVGKEFIELYNPSRTDVIELSRYKLSIGSGLVSSKTYGFPDGSVILPGQYVAYFNDTIRFTLVNTTNTVQLLFDGNGIGEPVTYTDLVEGASYSLLDARWVYTLPSPSLENIQPTTASLPLDSKKEQARSSTPCRADQYRHPETNRCRNLTSSADSAPKPCEAGQYRSAETGRCRNLASAAEVKAACKTGQERNPETNRCRTIVAMSDAPHGVEGVQTQNVGVNWYYWLGIGGIIAIVLAYAVWEWREELRQVWQNLKVKFARIKN